MEELFLKYQNTFWKRKAICHLPYILTVSSLPRLLRVMKNALKVATCTSNFKHRFEAMFESKFEPYLPCKDIGSYVGMSLKLTARTIRTESLETGYFL